MSAENPDLRERKFGNLHVVRTDTEVWVTPVLWFCFCDCGEHISALETDLLNGEVTSCAICAESIQNA